MSYVHRSASLRLVVSFIVIMLLSFTSGCASDETAESTDTQEVSPAVSTTIEYEQTNFTTLFTFEQLPQAMLPVTVKFQMEYTGETTMSELNLSVIRVRGKIDVFGDSTFVWDGPINEGDSFTGEFTFVPNASGVFTTTLRIDELSTAANYVGPRFTLCMDEHGEVQYLNVPNPEATEKCTTIFATYFEGDTITVFPANADPWEEWYGVVTPIPEIGDTSGWTFFVTALNEWPNGARLEAYTVGLDVIKYPDRITGPVKAGDTLELPFELVPDVRFPRKGVSVRITPLPLDDGRDSGKQILCELLGWFGEEGKLLFASHASPGGGTDRYEPSWHGSQTGYRIRLVLPVAGEVVFERDEVAPTK